MFFQRVKQPLSEIHLVYFQIRHGKTQLQMFLIWAWISLNNQFETMGFRQRVAF